MRTLALLLLAAPLAACDGNGASISITSKNADGNTLVSTDANGQMAIKAEGFEGSIKLPKIKIDAEDFDLNGVKLYPGSTIGGLDVNAVEQKGEDKGKVSVAFTSPAPIATVQAWFRDTMAKRNFKVEADGTGLKGTTDEGDAFRLALTADGADKAKGSLHVGN